MTTVKGRALITGASAGIGAVYADRMAQRGFDLLLVARREDRLKEMAQTLSQQYGVDVVTCVADLTSDEDLGRVESILKALPDIEVVVNNAGAAVIAPTLQAPLAKLLAVLQLNVTAVTRLSIAALERFSKQDRGTLVNVSSMTAYGAIEYSTVYSGTKAYIVNFTRSLQFEYAKTKIRIQLTLPGPTVTEFIRAAGADDAIMPREIFITAEEFVDAALAGLDQGEDVTIPTLLEPADWRAYDEARESIFQKTQCGRVAARYLP